MPVPSFYRQGLLCPGTVLAQLLGVPSHLRGQFYWCRPDGPPAVRYAAFQFYTKAAAVLIAVKNADSLGSLFILGFLCNIFVFLAVEGYRSFPHAIGKYAAIFLGIAVFILSGYEHSIADMFYYFTAGAMDLAALGRILVIALGNTCGGLISHEAVQFARRAQK